MKPFLLYERYDSHAKPPINANDLIQDLNLDIVIDAMAQSDRYIADVSRKIILTGLNDIAAIHYRHEVLRDCIHYPSCIRSIYGIASTALSDAVYYEGCMKPNYARVVPVMSRVSSSVGLLEISVSALEDLRNALSISDGFLSKGLCGLRELIQSYMNDQTMSAVKGYIGELKRLSLNEHISLGAEIGLGAKGQNYVLRSVSKIVPVESKPTGIFKKRAGTNTKASNTIELDNISLITAAGALQDAAMISILQITNHFSERCLTFFRMLREEAGFYVGCINLYDELKRIGVPVCYPEPLGVTERVLTFEGLYDLSITLNERKPAVSNDLSSADKILYIITGANQGGKSTFLRSIGLAQLMMQCGMFTPALLFSANLSDSLFTHFTREEDAQMNSGKLAEELTRISGILERINSNSLLLMNETFATTTEREGSRIARDIIRALFECKIKTLFVTHLYEFADMLYCESKNGHINEALFLRAARTEGGGRSFTIEHGEPLKTSFGMDLYAQIMGGKYDPI